MRVLAIGAAMALSLLSFVSTPASAAVTYNSTLSPPGVYAGTGNGGLANWAVNTGANLDLAVNVVERFMGGVTPTVDNIYSVPLGLTTVPGKSGSWWGFGFSVRADTPATLGQYTYLLTVENLLTGNTFTIDPTLIPDNAGTDGTNVIGGGAGCSGGNSANIACAAATRTGFQNFEALSFNGSPSVFDPTYDPNVNNSWWVTLSAFQGGTLALSINERINAGVGVMEPSSVLSFILALGVLGCIAYTRRRDGTGNGGSGAANDNGAQSAAA